MEDEEIFEGKFIGMEEFSRGKRTDREGGEVKREVESEEKEDYNS